MEGTQGNISISDADQVSSLPVIQQGVTAVLETLQGHIASSLEREVRLQKKLDDIVQELNIVKAELAAMKEASRQPVKSFSGVLTGNAARAASGSGDLSRGDAHPRPPSRAARPVGTAPHGLAGDPGTPSQQTACTPMMTPQSRVDLLAPSAPATADCAVKRRHTDQGMHLCAQLTEMSAEDKEWQIVSKQPPKPKRAVLYVGNLEEDLTKEKTTLYIAVRAKRAGSTVNLHSVDMLKGKIYGARIEVDETDVDLLMNKYFWPRPMYCRRWTFKENSQRSERDIDALLKAERSKAEGLAGQSHGDKQPGQNAPEMVAEQPGHNTPNAKCPEQVDRDVAELLAPGRNPRRQRESPLDSDDPKRLNRRRRLST